MTERLTIILRPLEGGQLDVTLLPRIFPDQHSSEEIESLKAGLSGLEAQLQESYKTSQTKEHSTWKAFKSWAASQERVSKAIIDAHDLGIFTVDWRVCGSESEVDDAETKALCDSIVESFWERPAAEKRDRGLGLGTQLDQLLARSRLSARFWREQWAKWTQRI